MYVEQSCRISDELNIKRQVYGGQNALTLISPSKVSRVYLFKPPIHPEDFDSSVRFAYVKDNHAAWNYVGMLKHGQFYATGMSQFSTSSPEFRGADFIVNVAEGHRKLLPMELYHEGKCARCGRTLLTPKSIKDGVGPRCKRLIQVNWATEANNA